MCAAGRSGRGPPRSRRRRSPSRPGCPPRGRRAHALLPAPSALYGAAPGEEEIDLSLPELFGSRVRAGGVGSLQVPAPVTMDSFFFGCELSGHTRSFTFKVEEEDDAEHVLALTMLCLTEGAKDECNVVEVVARNHDHQEIAVPVANLKLSCQPMLSLDDFQLQPPVTFRLKSGSGPVRITGRHQIVTISNDLSGEESEEDGSEEEEAELCPILPAKKLGRRL